MIHEQVHKLEQWSGNNLGFDPVRHLNESTRLLQDIGTAVADVPFFIKKKFASVEELGTYRLVLYCMVRLFKPAVFIETGVLHGLTSMFILQALSENQHGKLISIDLPSYFETGPSNQDGFTDTLPPGLEPGWIIPERMRTIWDLRLGSSREQLPGVVQECAGKSTIFLHDSDHTSENMLWEFECTWTGLDALQMIVSDNVNVNTAFFDFAYKVDRIALAFPDTDGTLRFGIIPR
ncbi:MAG: class I SAM-dependent methyltransferase [Humidesulfovibrio sp.]|uniref:class I SAM-dependent methyltransferase n=1 Tax=Humidesulfovibrio sp. TaxID=2910988 RepID=UPI0027FF5E9B|nr:class I SAM-dependent methyltransferase [Humidesulfovibrio sp.]MDQ7834258.1 class I SAM-dependent methyltransferase [Humidesulfovibrio sp.]